MKKTQNSHSNPEEKQQSWRHSCFQTLDNAMSAQQSKQCGIGTKIAKWLNGNKDRKRRDKLIPKFTYDPCWSINLLTKQARTYNGKDSPFNRLINNQNTPSNHLHKNSVWLKHLNIRYDTMKFLQEEHSQNILPAMPVAAWFSGVSLPK